MSKKREAAGVPGAVLNADGPWGGGESSDEQPSGKKGGRKAGGKSGSDGESGGGSGDGGGSGGGPRNPWDFPPEGPKQPRRGPIDEILSEKFRDALSRRGNGGGNSPIPGGISQYWPWLLAAFALLWIGFTSVHRIGPQERGVILRMGSYAGTLPPGVSFTLPAPFDTVDKIDVSIRELPIGTVTDGNGKMVLTADQNLVSLTYTVRWRVSNPELYKFQIADPDQLVSQVAESAMREVLANYNFIDAIGPRRNDIQVRVANRIQEVLNFYKAGIIIEGVAISKADPPREVNDAFKRVTVSQQNAQKAINDANAYARQVVAIAEGESAAFNKVYEQYKLAPGVTRRRMYYETMEGVLQNTDKTIVEVPGVTTYLPLPGMQRRAATPEAPKGGQ